MPSFVERMRRRRSPQSLPRSPSLGHCGTLARGGTEGRDGGREAREVQDGPRPCAVTSHFSLSCPPDSGRTSSGRAPPTRASDAVGGCRGAPNRAKEAWSGPEDGYLVSSPPIFTLRRMAISYSQAEGCCRKSEAP